MSAYRQIGKVTRRVLEVMESHGRCFINDIAMGMPGYDTGNLRRMLATAANYNLCTLEYEPGNRGMRCVYTIAQNWREIADLRAAKAPKPFTPRDHASRKPGWEGEFTPQGRPIGNRIREICQALETHGPCGRARLSELLPTIKKPNISEYTAKAVRMGLATVKHGRGNGSDFNVWTVTPNWRELIDAPWEHLNSVQVGTSTWGRVNSVFSLGAMA